MKRSPIKRKSPKARMVDALDKAARHEIVIERDADTCQRCGIANGDWDAYVRRYAVIQWCHVHTREYYVTRWEPDNSFAGCDRCHMWFDNHKVLSYEWFAKKWPERWHNIQRILNSGAKANVKQLYEELQGSMRQEPQAPAVETTQEVTK